MGALTWIFTISFCIVAECHLQIFKHPRFHLIPKFPEDFFSYADSFNHDSEPVAPVTLVDQHAGDINEKEIEDDSDILAKKLPEEKHEDDIIKEKRSDQEQLKIQPEPVKIIAGTPEDAILSVQQQEPINRDIPADPKLENAERTIKKPLEDSDADSKKDDQELTKNTDYVLIPVAAINADQLNPNIANQNVANQAGSYPLQATNLNVQPNQFGTTAPQNYVPFNNGVNNNGGQPMYVVNVPNNVTPQGNNPANAIYYLNNPSNNNMGYQGVAGTPYNLVSLGYQQNNQPNNYVVPVNQPNNLVATNQPMRSVPSNNPNGYYVMPNNAYNQPNYLTGYVNQPNNPNGYVIQPNNGNNLNYQQNNPGRYIQPNNNNNLNYQQNYPNGYYVQPNNLNNQNGYNNPNNMNYQQNNPNGYVNQPNNYPNVYNNQPNNPNGYGNQPNSFNNYPNNYNNHPNNQYSNVNPANNFSGQPNEQENSYANNPNNNNFQPNNPNGNNAQPLDLNNQLNYPNGYNNQPNNVDSYKDKQNNLALINSSGNLGTAGNVPQVLKTSEISDNNILVPLFAFKDNKDSVDVKDEDVQKDVESKE